MKIHCNLIYLILILTLNFSCVEKKSTEKETNKPEFVATSKTDTLKFGSEIRAIFQDSKSCYRLEAPYCSCPGQEEVIVTSCFW